MAHLLGSEYCLKSLSSDARDLHNVLQELIAKAGPVPVMSWKFPDKKACDLDIPYLLQQYAFCMDEPEANQVSHIVLLELVQSAATSAVPVYPDSSPAEAGQSSGSQTHAGGSSLGLAAKKFWNRMGQMSLLVRQLTDEARLSELRQQQQKEEKQHSYPATVALRCSTGFPAISAHLLSALCEKERLPSSLRIYRAQLQQANGGFDGDWLAASDLVRWSVELEKEANRLVKHFNQVSDTSAQLKRQNADADRSPGTSENSRGQIRPGSSGRCRKSGQIPAGARIENGQAGQALMKDIEAAKKSIEQQEELIKLLDRVKNRVKQVSKRDDLSLEDLELAVGSVGERLTDLTDQRRCKKSEDEKRLLIEYPDLNGPVNQDVEGTGDPLADMRQQVFANETRIRLLTEQTSSMRRALERVWQEA
uniref:HAUS augmin-like complex subunit 7 n=1 Tax=Macrostomum lignano TaxID=282301 RepID=A0A1I8FV07_9PLAT